VNYDVHNHAIPAETIEMLRREGGSFGIEIAENEDGRTVVKVGGATGAGPLPDALGNFDSRIATMDAAGVDVHIVSYRTDLTAYFIDPVDGARYSRLLNRYMADEVSKHPSRLIGLATVPLQAPGDAAEELAFAVQELGMIGVEIGTNVNGVYFDQAGLDPFWEAAEALGCLILLHPSHPPLPGVDLSRHFIHNMVGRPAESTVSIAHMMFSGVFDRYPGLTVCMVHGGGFMPFQLGRFQKGFTVAPQEAAAETSRPPEEIARHVYYDSLLHTPETLRFLIDRVGATQILMGSDYPYRMHDRDPVGTINAIPGLTDEERSLIFEGNARRILDTVRR
jgi:aminocarboxymuconate-semialdehyde decarboxylase